MSSLSLVYLSLIIFFSAFVNSSEFCGKRRFFDEPKGTIETNLRSGRFQNCTWSIKTPYRTVIYILIHYLQLGIYDNISKNKNCLHITSINKSLNYLKICNTTDYFDSLSIPNNDVRINLEFTSNSFLGMTYTSYIVDCIPERLKCIPPRNFRKRKPYDACAGGMLKCNEMCSNPTTACGDICYDVVNQRCDRVLDCVYAADELGCNPKVCPHQIQCLNETKCLRQQQICDKKVDCKNGWDEHHCPKTYCEHGEAGCLMKKSGKNNLTMTESIYLIAIVFALLAILFLCMMFRCLAARRNVRNMLDNPLDIPLPPFRGPGESSDAGEDHPFTDEDFKPGGEIYESFVQNVHKIKLKRKNLLEIENDGITFVKPPPEKIVEKYFNGVEPVISEELAALATIKISREMCYGLRKTKSDEVHLTKLLFVDNIDDNLSEDDQDRDRDGAGDWRKEIPKPPSKSDTDYVKKRRREFNIV